MKNKWQKFKNWYKKDLKKSIFLTFMLVLVVVSFIPPPSSKEDIPQQAQSNGREKVDTTQRSKGDSKRNVISYVEFEKMLESGKVKEAEIRLKSPTFIFKTDEKDKVYTTENPKTETFKETLLKANVKVIEIEKTTSELIVGTISSMFPLLLLILVYVYFSKSMRPVNTKNKEVTTIPKTVFDHIAGNQESIQEMKFLVDFLKKPDRFTKMGAKLPKGVILYGPPGTGKTLTAKAIAGEAKVPFFSLSGSDFAEMFVGVGAKRVRELFEEARKKAPAIIFIDEIDSLGSNRDFGTNAEDRKTLNAILNEMDGFKENSGIVVIGATNRLEDLDSAFIRPGRFDKHIAVALPDTKGRLEILKLHAKNKNLASDVNLENLAKITMGMSGAYLETLLNEATILATTREREVVTEEDIDDAYYKLIVKGHKKKRDNKEQEKEIEIIAWHEAGHALMAKLLDTSDVPKVTITPSTTGIGGFALITPKKQNLYSKIELKNQVKGLYAGRIAEHLLLNDEEQITIGASQDIKQATSILKSMILDYGMTEKFGMVNLSALADPRTSHISNHEGFIEEVTELSKELYQQAYELLSTHKHVLKAIAETLMEKETIVEEELETIIKTHIKTPKVDKQKTISIKHVLKAVSDTLHEEDTIPEEDLVNIIKSHSK